MRGVVGEMHQEIVKLKDRVRVLEKLVTDDDRRLADEIDDCEEQTLAPASSGAGKKPPGVKAIGDARLDGRGFSEGLRCD